MYTIIDTINNVLLPKLNQQDELKDTIIYDIKEYLKDFYDRSKDKDFCNLNQLLVNDDTERNYYRPINEYMLDSKITDFYYFLRSKEYSNELKELNIDLYNEYTTLENKLEKIISSRCIKPITDNVLLFRFLGVSKEFFDIKEISNTNLQYLSTVPIENINDITTYHHNKYILVIKVLANTIIFNMKDFGNDEKEKGEIIIDKGGILYVKDIYEINDYNFVYCIYYPKNTLNKTCNIPSLFLKEYKKYNKDELINFYEDDISNCLKLNDQIRLKDSSSLRIMTYNIHEFKSSRNIKNVKSIIDLIFKIDPDILCLQEYIDNQEAFNKLSEKYKYNVITNSEPYGTVTNNLKICIFSKHEIKYTKFYDLNSGEKSNIKDNRRMIMCDIVVNLKELTICNLHTCANNTNYQPYNQINNLLEIIINDYKTKNYIICGDFNVINESIYTLDELEILKLNEYNKPKRFITFKQLNKIFNIKKIPNVKLTVWSGRAVDMIFPDLNKFKYIYNSVYFSDLSDHLPYFMDLKFK